MSTIALFTLPNGIGHGQSWPMTKETHVSPLVRSSSAAQYACAARIASGSVPSVTIGCGSCGTSRGTNEFIVTFRDREPIDSSLLKEYGFSKLCEEHDIATQVADSRKVTMNHYRANSDSARPPAPDHGSAGSRPTRPRDACPTSVSESAGVSG